MTIQPLVFGVELKQTLQSTLAQARGFKLALAHVTCSGLAELLPAMRAVMKRGGAGTVLVGTDLAAEPEALEQLCQLATEYPSKRIGHVGFRVRRFQSSSGGIFHPKLYLFGSATSMSAAVVGSANLTSGGLSKNREVSVSIRDATAVRKLENYFDEEFSGGHARDIDADWLRQYKRQWPALRRANARLRRLAEKVRHTRAPRHVPPPSRIKGHRFCFTGAIPEWPRDAKLYPAVQRLGGSIARTSKLLANVEFLVHGELSGDRKSTRKLEGARELAIPVITEEEFFHAMKRELRMRKRPRS